MKSLIRDFSIYLFVFIVLSVSVSAQTKAARKNAAAKKSANHVVARSSEQKPPLEKEKAAFDEAQNLSNAPERIEKLKAFASKYSRSGLKTRALELIVGARAEIADENLRAGDSKSGIEQFRLAVTEAPADMSDKLFIEVLSKIPTNLFFRGERVAALEAAKRIERKAWENADRLLALTQFYIVTENAEEARRIAERATALNPNSAAAQMVLGMANRIGFRLEAASQNFSRALELDGKAVAAKRSLADTWRGLGQNEEAIKLYREILAENAQDEAARTGLILSLFGANERAEAEREMEAALTANPRNLALIVGAAYWYAANREGAKAVEFGNRAVEIEPRYTWSHIALARGLLLEKRPLEAERTLLSAKQYGNFPTLDYELATVRLAAGLYEDAANDLRRTFQLKNGIIETRLAGRALQQSSNFTELLALERRAAILQPAAADSIENAEQLKKLLELSNAFNSEKKDEAVLTEAVQNFVAGEDAARTHRQLYAANRLLKENIALPQVLELTQAATNGVDAATEIPGASAAVLAEELYEPRRLAAIRGSAIVVPDIPKNTLSNILRGRIEEITGWTLYNQDKADEAVVRLKRAIGILPVDSAWWRSSQWRLGAALEKSGKPREALEAYIKSYRSQPDETRRIIIAALYERINGSQSGLDVRLGERTAQNIPAAAPTPASQTTAAFRNPLPGVIAEINPKKTPETPPAAIATTETKSPTINDKSQTTSNTELSPEATPSPEAVPTPQASAEDVKPVTKVEATPEPKPETTPEATTTPTPEPSPETGTKTARQVDNRATVEPTPEVKVEPTPEVKSENQTSSETSAQPSPSPTTESIAKTEASAAPATTSAISTDAPRLRVLLIDNLANTVKDVSPIKAGDSAWQDSPYVEKQDNLKPETQRKPRVRCAFRTSQNAVSVLRNGGTASVLITLEGAVTLENLSVANDIPYDLEIRVDEEAKRAGNRVLYEIRSISERTGEFTVTFESPCGKKALKVRVR